MHDIDFQALHIFSNNKNLNIIHLHLLITLLNHEHITEQKAMRKI